jgi:hypothetical protein
MLYVVVPTIDIDKKKVKSGQHHHQTKVFFICVQNLLVT